MEKKCLFSVLFVLSFLGGLLTSTFWEETKRQRAFVTKPEGYTDPDKDHSNRGKTNRVERLDIAEEVHKYHEILDLVAFAPGSGWIRFKTRDELSPTVNFFNSTMDDIRRFNAFSKSIGEPIRLALRGNVLSITAEETGQDLARFANKSDSESVRLKGFYHPEPLTQIAIRRDNIGRIFLVKAESREEKKAIALQKD